uniref:THAP-type domain-containing protein n=1 Tax=Myripristis murdjan TaxID=586833 RepID=A0A667ZMG6_9TELE
MPSICCAVGCDNKRWIAAIRRDHWTPTEHSRLCSEHFVSGKKSDNPLCPDYVPSLFSYLTPEQPVKRKRRWQSGEHSYSKDPILTESSAAAACSNEACQATMKKLTEECTRLRAEVCQLRDRVSKLSFQQEAFKDNDDKVQDLTGLPSYAKMMVVFTFLAGFLKVCCALCNICPSVVPSE